jgi:hypothetical protein
VSLALEFLFPFSLKETRSIRIKTAVSLVSRFGLFQRPLAYGTVHMGGAEENVFEIYILAMRIGPLKQYFNIDSKKSLKNSHTI